MQFSYIVFWKYLLTGMYNRDDESDEDSCSRLDTSHVDILPINHACSVSYLIGFVSVFLTEYHLIHEGSQAATRGLESNTRARSS